MKKTMIAIISVICTLAVCVSTYFMIGYFSRTNDTKSDKVKNYICVLHFQYNSFSDPYTYPVKKYTVAYNGKYKKDFFKCGNDGESIKIKLDEEEITIRFDTHTEKLKYTKNKICSYRVPIVDAIETWEFIISDEPIQHELFYSGYKEKHSGVYYNIEDMNEHDSRQKEKYKRLPHEKLSN